MFTLYLLLDSCIYLFDLYLFFKELLLLLLLFYFVMKNKQNNFKKIRKMVKAKNKTRRKITCMQCKQLLSLSSCLDLFLKYLLIFIVFILNSAHVSSKLLGVAFLSCFYCCHVFFLLIFIF